MYREILRESMGKILFLYNYKMIVNNEHNIYFAKRYSNKLAIYIRCDINERNSLTIDLYFTGIQVPDDRICDINMGVNVYVGLIAADDCEKIIMAGKRILEIEKNIVDMEEVILSEYENPFFELKLINHYYESLSVYNAILDNIELKNELELLKNSINKAIINEDKATINNLCKNFIEGLPKEYFVGKKIKLDKKDISKCFAEQIYAECVLDV